jgi:RNA polymerase sigma-70 factor, ECF subfamily
MALRPLGDPVPGSTDDVALLDRIRASDSDALEAAMKRHWTPLMRYAAGLATDEDTAEDAVQEAFIRLWARRKHWTMSRSLRGLLFRVVRNRLLNQRRSAQVRSRWMERLSRRPARPPSTPDQVTELKDLSAAVTSALAALPLRRREAFVLIRYSGLSYREAAEVMGVSPQTVANQMSAALTTLREALAPHLPGEQSAPSSFPHGRRTG